MNLVRRFIPRRVVIVVASIAGAAGIAAAASFIPSSDQVITACYKENNGTLRLVASAADCRDNERAITWNISGPRGAPGAQGTPGMTGPEGPQGPQGPQGVQGLPGSTGSQGAEGRQGLMGVPGAKGDQGIQGPAGPQGPAAPGTEAPHYAVDYGVSLDGVFVGVAQNLDGCRIGRLAQPESPGGRRPGIEPCTFELPLSARIVASLERLAQAAHGEPTEIFRTVLIGPREVRPGTSETLELTQAFFSELALLDIDRSRDEPVVVRVKLQASWLRYVAAGVTGIVAPISSSRIEVVFHDATVPVRDVLDKAVIAGLLGFSTDVVETPYQGFPTPRYEPGAVSLAGAVSWKIGAADLVAGVTVKRLEEWVNDLPGFFGPVDPREQPLRSVFLSSLGSL